MMGGGGLEVSATQDSMKYAGAFMMRAEGVSGVKAEQLEEAMYEVLDDLRKNPVPEQELQKVKNQLRVETIRFLDLMSGIGMLFYLGSNAAMGDWTEANNNPDRCDAVTAEDVQRVASRYFDKSRRNVLIINSKETGEEESPGGGDPMLAQVTQMIESMTDAAQLEQMMGMLSMRMEQVEDPERRTGMEKLLELATERLKELKAAETE